MVAQSELLIATFEVGDALFGLDTAFIQEVVMPGDITAIHHAPPYIAGIRNLRGRIVTVIDLGVRLGLSQSADSSEQRILVADWKGEPIGLRVDRMQEMVLLDPARLEPVGEDASGIPGEMISGIFRNSDRIIVLLQAAAVLSPAEPEGALAQ